MQRQKTANKNDNFNKELSKTIDKNENKAGRKVL